MIDARNPSQVGAESEREIAHALSRADRAVFVPFFNAHSRVDLIYMCADGTARRVQCKTARLVDGCVTFWTCSNTGGSRKTYEGEVDEFGVYCPELDAVYLVPIEDLPTRQARLRLAPTKSNQARGIRWAEQYRLK